MVVNCSVTLCEPVNQTVYRIFLEPEANLKFSFHAGQYLNIQHPDGSSNPFSIASTPDEHSRLELHIDHHDSTAPIIKRLQNEGSTRIELPLGDCHLPNPLSLKPEAPVILVAASTGYAQMQSILLKLLNSGISNPIHLYWGAKQASGFYMLEQLEQWQKQFSNFHFTPTVSEATDECQWQGREGLIHQSIIEDIDNLQDAEVYISGSPLMDYATLDVLVSHGLPEQQAYSDVFHYAPRIKETKTAKS